MDTAVSAPPPGEVPTRGAGIGGEVSGIIAILTSATGHHSAICDDDSLPEVFHEAARSLLRVRELLQLIESQLARRSPHRPRDALAALKTCDKRARLSEEVLKEVSQAPEALRLQYYRAAVQRRSRESMVEVLAIGMMDDVCSLAGDGAFEGVTTSQAEALRALRRDLVAGEPSIPDDRGRYTFVNHGSGSQFNAPGGYQNNNMGSGNQFPGATFSGTVHFGSASS